jgi:hypothetical protein
MAHDLVLAGCRVIDPPQGIDRATSVAFAGGRVAAIGADAAGAAEVGDVPGHLVAHGPIDLHGHVSRGGTALGIDAEDFCRTGGVTTAVDTGSPGPGNVAGFRAHAIERSAVRILACLHVSFAGICAFGRRVSVGESEEMRPMAPADAVAAAQADRDAIVGIKLRLGLHGSATSGLAPLRIARQLAEQVGMPVMARIGQPPPTHEEAADLLRPGEVLTLAFRPFPDAPVDGKGRVKPAVQRARERGGDLRHPPRQGLVRLRHRPGDAAGGHAAGGHAAGGSHGTLRLRAPRPTRSPGPAVRAGPGRSPVRGSGRMSRRRPFRASQARRTADQVRWECGWGGCRAGPTVAVCFLQDKDRTWHAESAKGIPPGRPANYLRLSD